jgi:hypothetical protein
VDVDELVGKSLAVLDAGSQVGKVSPSFELPG